MSFSDLAWEERDQSRTRHHLLRDFDHRAEHLDFFSDLPDWKEVKTSRANRGSRVEFFDGLTVLGYLAIAMFLMISTVFSLLNEHGAGSLLRLVGSIIALFLAVGRIIEVRWRSRNDI